MNFREHMMSLRLLSNDHYQNKISFSDYRQQRSDLLKLIDQELNGIDVELQSKELNERVDESLINKALSFFKDR